MMRSGLKELGLLADASAAEDVLAAFDRLLIRLQDIAIRELQDQPLTNDLAFLGDFATSYDDLLGRISRLGGPIRGMGDLLADDLWTTIAADVQTNLWAGEVLEEGSGTLELLVVAPRIPGGESHFVAAGPVFTYYEFRHPANDRLTDQVWREMLDGDSPPAHAPWTCSFRYPCSSGPDSPESAEGTARADAARRPSLTEWLVAHGGVPRSSVVSSSSARDLSTTGGLRHPLYGIPLDGSGWLDLEAFQVALDGRREAIERCYTAALAQAPALEGNVTFEVLIDERGGVTVEVPNAMPDLGDTGVPECIAAQLRAMSFSSHPPEGGEVRVRVPITLALEW